MRHRTIIDCVPGLDDSAAILLALASPEIDLLGISVVADNVPLAAAVHNARKIAEVAGRDDLQNHAGFHGLHIGTQIFGKYAHVGAFGENVLPAPQMPVSDEHAVAFIADAARAAARKGKKLPCAAWRR